MALPSDLRLRGSRAFDVLYRHGRRLHGTYVVVRTIEADSSLLSAPANAQAPSRCRCAVVVSTKVSKRAVRRNRLRRLVHAWLLNHCPTPAAGGKGQWVLISLRPGSLEAGPEAVLGECKVLFRKAGLIP